MNHEYRPIILTVFYKATCDDTSWKVFHVKLGTISLKEVLLQGSTDLLVQIQETQQNFIHYTTNWQHL